MVYILNPAKPLLPQVHTEISKELARVKPDCLVITSAKPDIAEEFLFPGLLTVLVLAPETGHITPEEFVKLREDLAKSGIRVIRGKHLLQEIYHSSSQRFRTLFPVEIMADTLKELPKGVKHCLESAVLAVDKQAVPAGSRVISIAGAGDIPDTAVLIEPKTSKNIIDSKILKIICHPYIRKF